MAVDTALIRGLTSRRTNPKTYPGSVVEPGPVTKLVTTTSSRESVSARRAPPATPGMIRGKVTRRNVCHGPA